MKTWVLSAIVYVVVVVGAYYAYTAVEGPSEEPPSHGQHEE